MARGAGPPRAASSCWGCLETLRATQRSDGSLVATYSSGHGAGSDSAHDGSWDEESRPYISINDAQSHSACASVYIRGNGCRWCLLVPAPMGRQGTPCLTCIVFCSPLMLLALVSPVLGCRQSAATGAMHGWHLTCPMPVLQVKGLDTDALQITHIQVNQAQKQRRRTYRAHGRINRECLCSSILLCRQQPHRLQRPACVCTAPVA